MKNNHTNPSNTLVLRLPMWRSRVVLFIMFMGFCALLFRAFWIQGPGNEFYEAKATKGSQREIEMRATRGKILDRNGQLIATSLEAKAVIAYTDNIPADLEPQKITQLAKLLEMSESDIKKRLNDERNQVLIEDASYRSKSRSIVSCTILKW